MKRQFAKLARNTTLLAAMVLAGITAMADAGSAHPKVYVTPDNGFEPTSSLHFRRRKWRLKS